MSQMKRCVKMSNPFPKIETSVSLQMDFKRCGKLNCICSKGVPHGPYFYLRWRVGGSQRRRYVIAGDVPLVLQQIAVHQSELISVAALHKTIRAQKHAS
jgi:hypothetical protein